MLMSSDWLQCACVCEGECVEYNKKGEVGECGERGKRDLRREQSVPCAVKETTTNAMVAKVKKITCHRKKVSECVRLCMRVGGE